MVLCRFSIAGDLSARDVGFGDENPQVPSYLCLPSLAGVMCLLQ